MTDFDDLDDLLGPLRAPATAAELAAENDVVGLMAAAHHSSKGNTMFTSRRARVATLVAAGIIGFGGVAAAGPKVLDFKSDESPSIEEVEPEEVVEVVEQEVDQEDEQEVDQEHEQEVEEQAVEEQAVEEQAVEDETAEEAKVEEVPSVDVEVVDDSEFPEGLCLDGNHGKTVSAVARGLALGDGRDREQNPEYPSVTDAAHSSCGKTETTAVEADDETDVETDVEIDDDLEAVETEATDDVEKADASPKQHGRPDKPGKPEHAGKGRSDK